MQADKNCSGIIRDGAELVCKHGFPLLPACRNNPMDHGPYKVTPCLNERFAARLFPETGKPKQRQPNTTLTSERTEGE